MARRVNKNQMAGKRGAGASAWYLPDRDCLRRYNYSNGAGWKTAKKWERKLSFSIKHTKRG